MKLRCALLSCACAAAMFLAAAAGAEPAPPDGFELAAHCTSDVHGRLSGETVLTPFDASLTSKRGQVFPATWQTIVDNGPPSNRIDLVIVGDGFTEPELPAYRARAEALAAALFAREPFASYAGHFNVHVVDVVSNESGISNDPQGVLRTTAMDMTMWCGGVERVVCVTVFKAYAYARNAPDVDQVIAIGNSSAYGGAALFSSNIVMMTAFNPLAGEVLVHEVGHSLGKLADEYVEGGGPYAGPEVAYANVSILNQTAMQSQMTKWWRWLGATIPGFDAPVSTFEGGLYTPIGIFRPSPDSLMRSLHRQFNPPSAEEIVRQIHLTVRPLDSATTTCCPLSAEDVVSIEPLQPVGGDLSIAWTLNNLPLPIGAATTIDIGSLGLSPGLYTLRVAAVDETTLVRDPAIRANQLTDTRTWSLDLRTTLADLNGDGHVTSTDLGILLGSWGSSHPLADLNGDGVVGTADLAQLLGSWG